MQNSTVISKWQLARCVQITEFKDHTFKMCEFKIPHDTPHTFFPCLSGGTSTLRLSSVRELPGQLQELYQQGFVLAAVHPFIHPCGPESNSPQHQLYRAILVRLSDG